MNKPESVESYLSDGCGRCELGGTPDCKVHNWEDIMVALRAILLSCDLQEGIKWGVPCYMVDGKNVLLLSAFKHFASLNFFKGSLLNDTYSMLERPGEKTQASRWLKFTSLDQVVSKEDAIRDYVLQAIQVEKDGKQVQFKKEGEDDIPEELQDRLDTDPLYREYFEALTPGRKRSYYLFIGSAKQAKTRASRVEKCFAKIQKGKGWNEYD